MVGSKAVTNNNLITSLRHELVHRPVRRFQPVRRLQDYLARTAAEELARIAGTQMPSQHGEVDPREQYRELPATPVRWVRLT